MGSGLMMPRTARRRPTRWPRPADCLRPAPPSPAAPGRAHLSAARHWRSRCCSRSPKRSPTEPSATTGTSQASSAASSPCGCSSGAGLAGRASSCCACCCAGSPGALPGSGDALGVRPGGERPPEGSSLMTSGSEAALCGRGCGAAAWGRSEVTPAVLSIIPAAGALLPLHRRRRGRPRCIAVQSAARGALLPWPAPPTPPPPRPAPPRPAHPRQPQLQRLHQLRVKHKLDAPCAVPLELPHTGELQLRRRGGAARAGVVCARARAQAPSRAAMLRPRWRSAPLPHCARTLMPRPARTCSAMRWSISTTTRCATARCAAAACASRL
jgi:hypothetical protein